MQNINYILLAILIMSLTGCGSKEVSAVSEPVDYDWTKYSIVAHAMGQIDKKTDTCTLEAFEYNYNMGTRVFETDFILTSDDELISRHDWSSGLYERFQQAEPVGNNGDPLSLKEIKAIPLYDELTPLDFTDIANIMSKHKDMFLITDTKEYDPELVKKQFQRIVDISNEVDPEILNRIVPQFYFEDMYYCINEIYNFDSYIYTLYMTSATPDEVLGFVKENNIKVVTMHYDRANEKYLASLNAAQIKCYIHTLNDVEKAMKYIDMGANGIYSDYITQADLDF